MLVGLVASGTLIGRRRYFQEHSVRGFTGCAPVDQGESRDLCNSRGRPIAELPHKRESVLENSGGVFVAASSVPAVCADEASVGRSVGTCLLCCLVIASVWAFSQVLLRSAKDHLDHIQGLGIVVISFVLTFATILAVSVARGSSLREMLNCLLLLHLKVSVGGSGTSRIFEREMATLGVQRMAAAG